MQISNTEAEFAQRGFCEHTYESRLRLEKIGRTFLDGYHAALSEHDRNLICYLDAIEVELRGFAYEGAAMGLSLLGYLAPWKRSRLQTFLKVEGMAHTYMVHVGVGWAFARLPWPIKHPPKWLDPLLGWLAFDGYGFHEGYFYWQHYVRDQMLPKGILGYARRVFDQGLGRSLWFVDGADVTRIAMTVATFDSTRRADLWSGVGLACTYAGGVNPSAIVDLKEAAEAYRPHLAQGAAFAAKARQRAGNSTEHTEAACEILCDLTMNEAANITDRALGGLLNNGMVPAYEVWRQRIQSRFSQEVRIV
jgi:hypothetical protein